MSELEKAIVNVPALSEELENNTLDAVRALQKEVTSLSKTVLQNRVVLGVLLASQGGACNECV